MRRRRFLLIGLLYATSAAAAPAPSVDPESGFKSLKERLSDKASDEQRVDNCRVPPDRRGSKPRPDCPETPPQDGRPPARASPQ